MVKIRCEDCGCFAEFVKFNDDGAVYYCRNCRSMENQGFHIDEKLTEEFWREIDEERIKEDPSWRERLNVISIHPRKKT